MVANSSMPEGEVEKKGRGGGGGERRRGGEKERWGGERAKE